MSVASVVGNTSSLVAVHCIKNNRQLEMMRQRIDEVSRVTNIKKGRLVDALSFNNISNRLTIKIHGKFHWNWT